MAQYTNYVKNPSSEVWSDGYFAVNAGGFANVSAVPSVTAPPTGDCGQYCARSQFSVSSTAAGAGIEIGHATTAGLHRITLPTNAAHTADLWVRPSKAKTLQLSARVFNISGSGVQVGSTVLGTATAIAAGVWTRLSVNFTNAANGNILVIRVADTDATRFVAPSDYVDVDGVRAYLAGTLPADYTDPSNNPMMGWTGIANQSESVLYVPAITLTPYLTASPSPRAEVLLVDLPPGTVTVRRAQEGRSYDVRGAVDRETFPAGISVLDMEVPFGIVATYQAEFFGVDGNSAGFSTTATVTMDVLDTWISQPLDPALAVRVDLDVTSADEIIRRFAGDVVYADGASVGRWIGGRRQGIRGLRLGVETDTIAEADELQAIFGTYTVDQMPVVCIRTPPVCGPRIPRTLFLVVPDLVEVDQNVRYGGTIVTFEMVGDEVRPPAGGVVAGVLHYEDTDAFYPTYSAIDAAYGTYLARDRDYSKAGYAA